MERALGLPPGSARDAAIHHARQAVGRVRCAAEAGRPALGEAAAHLGRRAEPVRRYATATGGERGWSAPIPTAGACYGGDREEPS